METKEMNLPEMVVGKTNNHTQYYRSFNPSQQKATSLLSKCYNGKTSVILPSGTAAISATLHSILLHFQTKELNIIYGSELYCDTPKVIKQLENYVTCNFYKIEIENDSLLKKGFAKINPKIPSIIFIESCSNPNGNIPDYGLLLREVNTIRKTGKALIVVDNTYVSSAIFNPFDYGADIVVLSLTKYYSGGNCIAGAAISNEELGDKIQNWTKLNGLHVSPVNCEIISENIPKMKARTEKTRKTTRKLADYCESKGYTVKYCGLKSHPNYERCLKFFKTDQPYSTFIIRLDLKRNDVFKVLESCGFDVLTSFGAKNSCFDSWPSSSKNSTKIRFSVGYEDVDSMDKMIAKFDKVFKVVKPPQKK
eukprot:gene13099-8516_t